MPPPPPRPEAKPRGPTPPRASGGPPPRTQRAESRGASGATCRGSPSRSVPRGCPHRRCCPASERRESTRRPGASPRRRFPGLRASIAGLDVSKTGAVAARATASLILRPEWSSGTTTPLLVSPAVRNLSRSSRGLLHLGSGSPQSGLQRSRFTAPQPIETTRTRTRGSGPALRRDPRGLHGREGLHARGRLVAPGARPALAGPCARRRLQSCLLRLQPAPGAPGSRGPPPSRQRRPPQPLRPPRRGLEAGGGRPQAAGAAAGRRRRPEAAPPRSKGRAI